MSEGEVLYPRPRKPMKKAKTDRRWHVKYEMLYDNGYITWSGYYRTRFGAKTRAFFERWINSYGGNAILYDQRKQ